MVVAVDRYVCVFYYLYSIIFEKLNSIRICIRSLKHYSLTSGPIPLKIRTTVTPVALLEDHSIGAPCLVVSPNDKDKSSQS